MKRIIFELVQHLILLVISVYILAIATVYFEHIDSKNVDISQ